MGERRNSGQHSVPLRGSRAVGKWGEAGNSISALPLIDDVMEILYQSESTLRELEKLAEDLEAQEEASESPDVRK